MEYFFWSISHGYNIIESATFEIRAYLRREKNTKVMYIFKVCLVYSLALLFPRSIGFYVKTINITFAASLNERKTFK